MEQAGLDVDTPFDAMSTEGKERIAQMMSHLAISESGWKITPQEILQVIGNGGVKQASPNANMQRIDQDVYDATKQANNNGVKYSMGGKDIGSKEGIDCSGWVTELLGNHVFKAENGFNNKVKDALGSKANPKTAAGIIKSLGGLANEELQGDVLTPDQIRQGLVIGITATSAKEKARTAKFYKGISHIVYTFEKNGQVYITESSRSSGVHSMPYTDWYNERVKNGAQLYGVDVNRLRSSSGSTNASAVQKRDPMYVAYENPTGMIDKGNIDLANRPRVKNKDGSISTVRSMSFNADGKEILIPTVSEDGRIMSDDEAIETYEKTGKHFGTFKTVQDAEEYAKKLHEQQEQMYVVGNQAQSGQAVSSNGDTRSIANSLIDPTKTVAFQKAIDAERLKQRQGLVLNDFAANPQAGIRFLSTPEGQARYRMNGKEADETINLLHTRFTHMKQAEKQNREDHEKILFTNAVNTALGVNGQKADPVAAYRMIAEDPSLDGKSKLEALKAIKEGTLDQDDPGYIIDVKNRIARSETVTDAELASAMATGHLSHKTKEQLLKMRDLADGPQGAIIKAAFKSLDEAYKTSMMADGTPEQAQAHYEAQYDLQMVIDEAQKRGNLNDLLNPNSKNYILPAIMQRHQLSMKQQIDALNNRVMGSGVPKRNGNESIEDYKKRVNGGIK